MYFLFYFTTFLSYFSVTELFHTICFFDSPDSSDWLGNSSVFLIVKISLLKRSFLKMLFQGCIMQNSSNSVILEISNLEHSGHN